MKAYNKIMEVLAEILNIIAIISLVFMMLLVVADVIMRNFFSNPIVGATEMVRMAMVCLVPSFVSALIGGQHVNVGIFIDPLGRKAQLLFDTIGHLIGMVVCGVISYQSYINMKFALKFNESYSMLKLAKWPLQLIFSITFGFMVPAILAVLISRFVDKNAYNCDAEVKEEQGNE